VTRAGGTIPRVDELFDFKTASVVVTGSSRGIGAAIARRFAEAGAKIVINCRDSLSSAEQVVGEMERAGAKAIAVRADVSTTSGVKQVLDAALAAYGRVTIWVNNAGVYPNSTLVAMSEAEWREVVDSSLSSVHFSTQAVAPAMRDCGGGVIINIASVEALQPGQSHAHYDAAKAAVIMHTRTSAQELGVHGIRVNCVSPGLIWREGLDETWPVGVKRFCEAAPLGCLGEPSDVADACLFLASPAARWITGTNLVVDGGVLTRPVF